MKREHWITALIAFVVTAGTLGIYQLFWSEEPTVRIEHVDATPAGVTSYNAEGTSPGVGFDFTSVAEKVTPAVVHIRSTASPSARQPRQPQQNPFRDFFGDEFFDQYFGPQQPRPRMGTGSGVIISEDGYIVTNNHVIDGADDIEVRLLDNRTFKARVIGADPTTDLALLQIKASDLPFLAFINSDEVRIGQWVAAVGNPFNLNSTITAGIVSAKARNINILREQYAVESFIQTDAAINPGNSGGALVDLSGNLIGINTAIASPTGAYSGYGFAVPSNLVEKVVADLIEFGSVQRGVLGVLIRTVDGNLAKAEGLSTTEGVLVDSLLANSPAGDAGVKPGDVIVEVDEREVRNASALQEAIATRRPGDEVNLRINRKGKTENITVTLGSRKDTSPELAATDSPVLESLGADLETLEEERARELDIPGGVRVNSIYGGALQRYTSMRPGFIITHLEGQPVRSVDELRQALEGKSGGVMVTGIYEDMPGTFDYAFGLPG